MHFRFTSISIGVTGLTGLLLGSVPEFYRKIKQFHEVAAFVANDPQFRKTPNRGNKRASQRNQKATKHSPINDLDILGTSPEGSGNRSESRERRRLASLEARLSKQQWRME